MSPRLKKEIYKRFGRVRIFPDGFPVSKGEHRGGSGLIRPIIQEKPWGGEVWLILTDRYAAKILFFEPGHRLSLQKHKKKKESWLVIQGRPKIILGKRQFTARPGQAFHVHPGTAHRIQAMKELVEVWETSSPELHDGLRLQDDYARVPKKYNPR